MSLYLEKNITNIRNKYEYDEVRNFLAERFLIRGDVDSAQVLLNLYNIEDQIENIVPSYISLSSLKKDVFKYLRHKEGVELIVYNLSNLIHNDINRFEFYMYLEGYKRGFSEVDAVNQLEILSFKFLGLEEMYKRKKLFNYDMKNTDVLDFKKYLFKDVRKDYSNILFLRNSVVKFYDGVLNKKIKNINSLMDRQMVLSFTGSKEKFVEQNSYLIKREIHGINRKITKFLYRDGMKVFENAYWDGVNDKVMKRYR